MKAAERAALLAARRFILRRYEILLESVCSSVDGRPNLANADRLARPEIRSFQRILAKLDGVAK